MPYATPLSPSREGSCCSSPSEVWEVPLHEEKREDPLLATTTTRVTFDQHVQVISIPSHRSYPERVRGALWTSLQEIRHNADRNMLEFAAEGLDWRNVIEEGEMLPSLDDHNDNGGQQKHQLIHPVHSNPLLVAALKRKIPYPIPISHTPLLPQRFEKGDSINNVVNDDENSNQVSLDYPVRDFGAVCSLTDPIERPGCPFVEETSASSEEEDSHYFGDPRHLDCRQGAAYVYVDQ